MVDAVDRIVELSLFGPPAFFSCSHHELKRNPGDLAVGDSDLKTKIHWEKRSSIFSLELSRIWSILSTGKHSRPFIFRFFPRKRATQVDD
jgi:hypothetical protein